MTTYAFSLLHVEQADGVLWATIDAPPINIMTGALFKELATLARTVATDDAVRAVVLQSADPDFFIAHYDVTNILRFPVAGPAERKSEASEQPGMTFRQGVRTRACWGLVISFAFMSMLLGVPVADTPAQLIDEVEAAHLGEMA